MSGKRKARPRTIARILERDQRKLLQDKLALAALEEGGSARRPISVESASVVESRALGFPCVACSNSCHLLGHDALIEREDRLRRVEVGCTRCGTRRYLYFRVVGSLLN
jgi:hypothetical protein